MKLAFALLCSCVALLAASGPDDRPITGAAPAPTEELVYTRSTSGPAWTPGGREIVFTTNLTGRNKVDSPERSTAWFDKYLIEARQ